MVCLQVEGDLLNQNNDETILLKFEFNLNPFHIWPYSALFIVLTAPNKRRIREIPIKRDYWQGENV